MKKKLVLLFLLIVSTIIILIIPLLLNNSWFSGTVSWYFAGLKTPDYKMTYISFLGGIIGVWMTVGTTLLIQMIFDSNDEKEKRKIADQIVLLFLEEIKKNHDALTTCNSSLHNFTAKGTTVLQLIKNVQYADISHFKNEFSLSGWVNNMNKVCEVDKEAYIILSKLYQCYGAVFNFKINGLNKKAYFEKTGILNYEKHYEKFKKRFGHLMTDNE